MIDLLLLLGPDGDDHDMEGEFDREEAGAGLPADVSKVMETVLAEKAREFLLRWSYEEVGSHIVFKLWFKPGTIDELTGLDQV